MQMLKELCHQMKDFVEDFKNQISTLCLCIWADGFQIFVLPRK